MSSYFHLQASYGCFVHINTTEILLALIWAYQGAAVLVHSIPADLKYWLMTEYTLLQHILALFVTPQNARTKMAGVFSRLSNVDFNHGV